MLAATVSFFGLPDRYDDAQRRPARILNTMLLIQGIAVSLILIIFPIADISHFGDPAMNAITVDLFVYVCAKILLNRGKLRLAAILMLVMQGLNLTGAIWVETGLRDMKVAALLGLIAMAGLILSRRDTIFVGLFTIIIVTLLYLSELSGVRIRESSDLIKIGDLAVLVSLTVIISALMFVASTYISRDLDSILVSERQIVQDNRRLAEEIRIQQIAEQELREINNNLSQTKKGLEDNVRRRTRDLARTNRDRETLLQVTSLDLKQPLNQIRQQSRQALALAGEPAGSPAHGYLERVVRAADRMDQLLNDVVKLVEVQQLDSVPTITDLNTIAAHVLERLEAQIEASRANIVVDTHLPKLYVDQLWASEALFNLVGNALKYHQPEQAPDILIQRYEDDSGLGIAVLDRGPGVAEEYRERIFELFKRTVNREVAGTGAGLAIVRQIANRHGGRAWVEDRPGGGASFCLTFGPASRVANE
ncbi:MAG: hypothetical protein KDE09_05960 [Anaerolineales bacterium]|nr:hypothetical protein [Anaerolineales bacterium]MCB0017318.1 hypothetical protein [Anaerolineales bacterium]MCB8961183.1 hypothetical protein [Ardenticatenales bacterium]